MNARLDEIKAKLASWDVPRTGWGWWDAGVAQAFDCDDVRWLLAEAEHERGMKEHFMALNESLLAQNAALRAERGRRLR
jgi:hypothetical protein